MFIIIHILQKEKNVNKMLKHKDCTETHFATFNGIETDVKKIDWLKISLLLKDPQFFANPYETWQK